MVRRTTVDQSSERALVAFLRDRARAPWQQLVIDHYSDTLDQQQAWVETREETARREALELCCRGIATEFADQPGYLPDLWRPEPLAAVA